VASFLFQTAGKLFGFDHVWVVFILVSVLVWLSWGSGHRSLVAGGLLKARTRQ
jgi:hypothetical protein